MKSIIKILLFMSLTLFLVSCSNNGTDYLGKWICTDCSNLRNDLGDNIINISKSGESFSVEIISGYDIGRGIYVLSKENNLVKSDGLTNSTIMLDENKIQITIDHHGNIHHLKKVEN